MNQKKNREASFFGKQFSQTENSWKLTTFYLFIYLFLLSYNQFSAEFFTQKQLSSHWNNFFLCVDNYNFLKIRNSFTAQLMKDGEYCISITQCLSQSIPYLQYYIGTMYYMLYRYYVLYTKYYIPYTIYYTKILMYQNITSRRY